MNCLFSKSIFGVMLILCLIVSANSQININSSAINFRTVATANNHTLHYGDLWLDGGNFGSSYGNLICNSGYFYESVGIETDLNVWGTKNFIQPHPTDTNKAIKYVAIESGEALTIARGIGKTVDGIAQISLPEHFSLVTSDSGPLTVIVTPENSPALLYIKAKTKQGITIAMKNNDRFEFGDVSFSYQVTGIRDGFENLEPIIELDKISKNEEALRNSAPVKNRLAFAKRYESARKKGKN